jgi:hypothetical protein
MDRTKLILDSLLDGSISGNIIWTPRSSIFNSDLNGSYQCKSDDGLTSFVIDISIDKDGKILYGGTLKINNKLLINGILYAYSKNFKVVDDITDFVFETYMKPNLKVKVVTEEDVLDNILLSIGKQKMRNDKLDNLLDD